MEHKSWGITFISILGEFKILIKIYLVSIICDEQRNLALIYVDVNNIFIRCILCMQSIHVYVYTCMHGNFTSAYTNCISVSIHI
jgi:hypothetical protein